MAHVDNYPHNLTRSEEQARIDELEHALGDALGELLGCGAAYERYPRPWNTPTPERA